MGEQKKVSAVRLDADQLSAVRSMAKGRRIGVSAMIRQIVDVFLQLSPDEIPVQGRPATDRPEILAAPLLVVNVSAGTPTLREDAKGERPYFFRRDFLERLGYDDMNPGRFGVYRLGDEDTASSMAPTILPGSVLLVDLLAARSEIPARSIWMVALGPKLVCKRVTLERNLAVLESDNRAAAFAPMVVDAHPKDRRRLLEGRVVWWATVA